MISSAEEFVRLRTSSRQDEYSLSADDEAPLAVWMDVIARYPDMKRWVAHNRTVPIEVLEVLSTDPDWIVRAAVADRRKLSRELFEVLSNDADDAVRERIAYNKKTPTEILRRLAGDPVSMVRVVALKRIGQQEIP